MAARRKQPGSSNLDEYQRSMREFREMLQRVGHKTADRLKHPRFIDDNSQSSRHPHH